MEPTEDTTQPLTLVEPPTSDVKVAIAPDVDLDGKAAEEVMGLDKLISELEEQLKQAEFKRAKSVVEQLPFDAKVFMKVAKQRREDRWPNIQKQIIAHAKALAYSGEKVCYFDIPSPIFNEPILKWINRDEVELGFKASIVKDINKNERLELRWDKDIR